MLAQIFAMILLMLHCLFVQHIIKFQPLRFSNVELLTKIGKVCKTKYVPFMAYIVVIVDVVAA